MKDKFNMPDESRSMTFFCNIIFAVIVACIVVLAFRNHFEYHGRSAVATDTQGSLDWLQRQAKEEYETGELSFEEYSQIMSNGYNE